jgi:hypothetical protein
MTTLPSRNGYAVAIRRKDGSEFLALTDKGISPAVWTLSQRTFAVEFKRHLMRHGFKCRVVRVLFADPMIVGP